jgi:predicted GNAT superfamily acetyltransferase
VTAKQEALEALDAMFRENEVPMSDRNGVLHDRLRQFIESAGEDSERYRWLRETCATVDYTKRPGEHLASAEVHGSQWVRRPTLDAAIDAALAARSPQPGEKG